jgi:hypothetical protein
VGLQVVDAFQGTDGELQGTVIKGQAGTVCLKSTMVKQAEFPRAIDELRSSAAKQEALVIAAQRGVADPRINGMSLAPYPVDAQGNSITNPLVQKTAEYRVDIPVTGRLV